MGIVSESNNLGEGDNPECQFRRFQTLSRFTRWMEIEEGACRIRNVGWYWPMARTKDGSTDHFMYDLWRDNALSGQGKVLVGYVMWIGVLV